MRHMRFVPHDRSREEGLCLIGEGAEQEELMAHGDGYGYLAFPPSQVADVSASSVRRALSRMVRWDGGTAVLYVCLQRPYRDFYPALPVSFSVGYDQKLLLVVETHLDGELEASVPAEVERLAQTFVRAEDAGLRLGGVWSDYDDEPEVSTIGVALIVPPRGRSLGPLIEFGERLAALLDAAQGDPLTLATTADLLRAGRPDALLGQQESSWLEVKRQEPEMDELGKITFVRDVAAFANSEGGLLVYGIEAKKVGGVEEVLRRIRPITGRPIRPHRYRQAIDRYVFPPVEGLEIEVVKVSGGAVTYLYVPPQPDELKPFLVHGAVVDGKVCGDFISIVRRSGESNWSTDARSIHGMLTTGRALLRHGLIDRQE